MLKQEKKRGYMKVTDAQREVLIEVLLQNDHITLRDASNLVNLNYESAKAIWTIFRKEGRRHNMKSHGLNMMSMAAQAKRKREDTVLANFDEESALHAHH